jgi:hypothetical protein
MTMQYSKSVLEWKHINEALPAGTMFKVQSTFGFDSKRNKLLLNPPEYDGWRPVRRDHLIELDPGVIGIIIGGHTYFNEILTSRVRSVLALFGSKIAVVPSERIMVIT